MKHPDTCPRCKEKIQPIPITNEKYNLPVVQNGPYNIIDLFQKIYSCPNEKCKTIFIGVFENFSGNNEILRDSLLLHYIEEKLFPKEIEEISKDFISIYHQANVADENGLHTIAGPGYRKALEFLMKDFLIKKHPEKELKIKKMSIGSYEFLDLIDDNKVKESFKRAIRLGNDQTHYYSKWDDLNLDDLKNLIDICINFITYSQSFEKYITSMPDKE